RPWAIRGAGGGYRIAGAPRSGPRIASSRSDPRVDADDPAVHGEVADIREARLLHRGLELMGVRKQGDRVGQVAIGRLAPRDEPADARQDVEEIIVVHGPPQFRRGGRELEYTGAAARTQH